MAPAYEPGDDSFLLAKWIPRQLKRHSKPRVLDMGSGSGILAVEAARYAADVVACDRNPAAVKATGEAVARARLDNVTVLESDLFSAVPNERFDAIIFNPPYLPAHPGAEDIALDGGRRGHELLVRFLGEALPHLKPEGELLVVFSSHTGRQRVEREIARLCLDSTVLEEKKLWFETLYLVSIARSALLRGLEEKGFTGIRLLALGKRGIVYSALKKEGGREREVAIKVANPRSEAVNRIENEAKWLRLLNSRGIGPRLLGFHPAEGDAPACLVMELIEGRPILDFLAEADAAGIRGVLGAVLKQLLALDRLGVNKGELHWPVKHIIVRPGNSAVLLDFERCRKTERPKNVTQFLQFLSSDRANALLRKKGIMLGPLALRQASRAYASGGKLSLPL